MATLPRSRRSMAIILLAGVLLCAAFLSLGIWQVERRSWKLDLIAQVNARVHALPAAAPGPPEWSGITQHRDGYRHIVARGRFLDRADTLVQALTERGSGFWVMTPLRTDAGFTILVNRGFVPADRPAAAYRAVAGRPVTVTGLLRLTEPKGGFLRTNDPAAGRWYSRDVAAIATAHGLGRIAPYFIDADAGADRGRLPVGGLTVITFPNNHLSYALTWFGLAFLVMLAMVIFTRAEARPGGRR